MINKGILDIYHTNPEKSKPNEQRWSVGLLYEPKNSIEKDLKEKGFEITTIKAQEALRSRLYVRSDYSYMVNSLRMSKSIVKYIKDSGLKCESSVVALSRKDDPSHLDFFYFPKEKGWLATSMDKYED